jgi:protein translocase SEC61 complex gamma subunit
MVDVATFWENTKRIVKLAKRPTRKEVWMQLKISFLGLIVVGLVAFFIRYIMFIVTGFFPGQE